MRGSIIGNVQRWEGKTRDVVSNFVGVTIQDVLRCNNVSLGNTNNSDLSTIEKWRILILTNALRFFLTRVKLRTVSQAMQTFELQIL